MPMTPIRGWSYYLSMSLIASLCFITFLIAGSIGYPVPAGAMLMNVMYMFFFMIDAYNTDKRKAKFQKAIEDERRQHAEYVKTHPDHIR